SSLHRWHRPPLRRAFPTRRSSDLLSGVARTLDRAFSTHHARAVALVINSPGGSAVQSHLIFRRVRQLAEEKHLPVIVFIEDVGRSEERRVWKDTISRSWVSQSNAV